MQDAAPSPRSAALAVVAACMIWGLSPLYYVQLAHVPPIEVLAHRTLWSVLFFTGFCALTGRLPRLRAALGDGAEVRRLALSAAMVSVNWGLFIWAVTTGRVAESALGYYIFPLVMTAAGALFYGERLRAMQVVAIGLAAAATAVLGYGAGAPPWAPLALAFSFTAYGMIKRACASGPIVSVTVEVILLAPLAAAWLIGAHGWGWTDFTGGAPGAFGRSWTEAALLVASGVITGAPLALYSLAARGLPMSTAGMIFYLNPTLQALMAYLLGEAPTLWRMIAFPMIWVGLALYSADAARTERRRRRAARAA
ncbi:EamA family transporter RarD [Rhodovulum sp. DZ06]|uniref:EamA family transporter RarD n=1 Tax=Rhodovulum sp. DZ06 TaxID=3425126 RepID=UPI003D32F7A1